MKNLSAMRETWVRSLGWEDALERAWQPTPVFLPGESLGTEEPGGLLVSMGSQRVEHDRATKQEQHNGKESEKEYVCITKSFCYTCETNTIL